VPYRDPHLIGGSGWVSRLKDSTTYNYDTTGQVIGTTQELYDIESGTITKRSEYEYLYFNGVKKTLYSRVSEFMPRNPEVQKETITEYEYYADYTDLAKSYYRYYNYDESGRLATYSQTSYNASDQRVKFTNENYIYMNINGKETRKVNNAYICNYLAGGEDILNETLTEYNYYENGVVMTKDTVYRDYQDLSKSYSRHYEYDASGKLIAYGQASYNANGDRIKITAETYIYMNISGKETKKVHDSYICNFAPGTDERLNETTSLYEYYETGITKTKDVTYMDHVNQSKSYHKIYHYDESGKLIWVEDAPLIDLSEPKINAAETSKTDPDFIGTLNVRGKIQDNKASIPEGVKVVPQEQKKDESRLSAAIKP
jgi:hypothetical protein